MKVALVCIAKNEDRYIEEWINYHVKLGFSHVFIYENDWDCVLERDDITKIRLDGPAMQTIAYNHFIVNYSKKYDWAAFFDVDEFLVLKKHRLISDFLFDYKDYAAVVINWVFFGDSGLSDMSVSDYSVINRFIKRNSVPDKHIKTIANLMHVTQMTTHYCLGSAVDTNLNPCNESPFNFNGTIDIAQLNHYFCKTKREYVEKMLRGRVSRRPLVWELFDLHNNNDVEDLYAYNFFNDIDTI